MYVAFVLMTPCLRDCSFDDVRRHNLPFLRRTPGLLRKLRLRADNILRSHSNPSPFVCFIFKVFTHLSHGYNACFCTAASLHHVARDLQAEEVQFVLDHKLGNLHLFKPLLLLGY